MRISTIFRRRAVGPADLPPVTGLPAALVPARPPLPARTPQAAPYTPTLAGLTNRAGDDVETTPAPLPADSIPSMTGIPLPLWRPGTYTVHYDRIGPYGRTLPAPAPLTAHALTSGDLATAICTDIRQLTGMQVSAVVDLAVNGGTLLATGGQRYGTFTYNLRGGAR